MTHKKKSKFEEELLESKYRDMVAQNAISVLHNIGNTLTAITGKISTHQIAEKMAMSNSVLRKMNDEFSTLETAEDFHEYFKRPNKILQFKKLLEHLSQSYSHTETEIKDDFDFVMDKCYHIGDIIAAQQKFANFKENKKEKLPLSDIISACLKMHEDKLKKYEIKVKTTIEMNSFIYMNKVGLAQTISNALINAIESINERYRLDPDLREKIIEISSYSDKEKHHIQIDDNGVGLSPEEKEKLFQYGGSSKSRGSGFGLHDMANFMRSNDGTIEVVSEGKNHGASVILTCPVFWELD